MELAQYIQMHVQIENQKGHVDWKGVTITVADEAYKAIAERDKTIAAQAARLAELEPPAPPPATEVYPLHQAGE